MSFVVEMNSGNEVIDSCSPDLCEEFPTYCDMCGKKHPTSDCRLLQNAPRISDSVTSRARVTLPSVLGLRVHLDTTVTVTCTSELQTGIVFGPMVAPRTENITNQQFPVKVFRPGGQPDLYLDTSDEDQCNWMCLVNPSSELHLQNLACLQMGDDIFFVVRRPVPAGTELRVWYSPFYADKLRRCGRPPLSLSPCPPADRTEVVLIRQPELHHNTETEEPETWFADLSRAAPPVEAAVSVRPCPLCQQTAAGAAALADHLLRRHGPSLAAAPATASSSCPVCGRETESGRALLSHLRRHRGDHRCCHCHKVFTRRASLLSHPCPGPRRAAEGRICPHCHRLFTSPAVWRRHVLRHSGTLRCADCGRQLASAAALAAHVCRARLPAGQLLRCARCPRHFVNAASLQKHAALHTERFACARCGRRFTGVAARRRHQALCGAAEQLRRQGRAACQQCAAQLPSLTALVEHLRAHELPHRCSTCAHRFRSQLQLVAHVCGRPAPGRPPSAGSPAPPPPSVCEVCAQTFTTKKALWMHRFTHAERQFACHLCPRKFKRKDTMQAHLATHTEPQVPCPHCDKRLKSKKSLVVHMRQHTGDARFSCDVCGKPFVQKVNMERHRRSHQPDHKLANRCGTCGKCFSGRHHLEQHQLEHSQGRTHRCSACSRTFLTQRDLQRHETGSHGAGRYECSFCHMTTKLKGSISRHLAKMHRSQEAQWSAPGYVDTLYSSGQPTDSILTLEPSSTLLLALPPGGDGLDSSLVRPPPGLLAAGAEADSDVLLYVIDVPDMEITFDGEE